MTTIESKIVIGRPVDVVFDYVADQRNEPHYNPRMVRAEKVTAGPVGKGTRLRSVVMSRGRPADMLIEFTGYDRPVRLAQVTTMCQTDMSGTLTLEPVGAGTRMRWSWRVRPQGRLPAAGSGDRPDGQAPGADRLGGHQTAAGGAAVGPAVAVLQRGRTGAKWSRP